MATNALEGFWGPVDSNNQWFEERYVYSPYVSEFWNSITSFVFIFDGLRGLWTCHKCNLRVRYRIPYLILIVTGFGSVIFHATSRWWAEVIDEVPMILLMHTFASLSRDHFTNINGYFFHTVNILATTCILGPYLYYHNYEVFVTGFTCYVIYLALLPFLTEGMTYQTEIFQWMIYPIILGRVVWESEQRLGIWWLHSVWHPIGSIAAMNGIKYFIIYQCERFGINHVCSKPPEGGFNAILHAFWLTPKTSSAKLVPSKKVQLPSTNNPTKI